MKNTRIAAFVAAIGILGGAVHMTGIIPKKNCIVASAEESYTEIKQNGMIFNVYGKYASVAGSETSISGDVAIPSSINGVPVTAIGDAAFYWREDITSFSIPSGIKTIGDYAFYKTSVTSISIPEGVTSIGNFAFSESSKLKDLLLPSTLTTIGNNAFRECKALKEIALSSGVSSIGIGAFTDCTSLYRIYVSPDNASYSSNGGVLFNKNRTELICFLASQSVTEYTIPSGVTTIGYEAFRKCTKLTNINFPDTLENIKTGAFTGCSKLKEAVLPASVSNIENKAFSDCSGLSSITILNPDCKIYDNSLTICSGLNSSGNTVMRGTIKGYKNSTAQKYANKYHYSFSEISGTPSTTAVKATLCGDANLDGMVSAADATAILQYLGNKDKYNFSDASLANADVFNVGDGVTALDALAIQKYDAKVITSLPEK